MHSLERHGSAVCLQSSWNCWSALRLGAALHDMTKLGRHSVQLCLQSWKHHCITELQDITPLAINFILIWRGTTNMGRVTLL